MKTKRFRLLNWISLLTDKDIVRWKKPIKKIENSKGKNRIDDTYIKKG